MQLNNHTLQRIAENIGLGDHLTVHPQRIVPPGRDDMATSLEAIFGAICLDCGRDIDIIKAAMTKIGIQLPGSDNN